MLPTAAFAEAPPLKPGLWEIVTESQQLNGKAMPDHQGEMAEQMKSLPPEVRKQVEAQMKSAGVQLGTAKGGGMSVQMCMSKEMLDENRWQGADGQCQSKMLGRTGDTWNWKMVCTKPPGHGEGATTMAPGGQAYASQMRMTMEQGGKPQTMAMKHRGTWISADCGSLKPLMPNVLPVPPVPRKPSQR